MRRTHRRMSLPVKIITWFIGILVVLAIVASIFVVASILLQVVRFITLKQTTFRIEIEKCKFVKW